MVARPSFAVFSAALLCPERAERYDSTPFPVPVEPMRKKKTASARRSAPAARLQDTVRLSAQGLAKVLGDLEARVMRVIWGLGRPAPARAVHERVAEEHPVAIHTVITVLNKLVGKGLLVREKQGDVFHYRAALGEDEFLAQASRRVVEGIL
jgi:predicted transcriptional regulator